MLACSQPTSLKEFHVVVQSHVRLEIGPETVRVSSEKFKLRQLITVEHRSLNLFPQFKYHLQYKYCCERDVTN